MRGLGEGASPSREKTASQCSEKSPWGDRAANFFEEEIFMNITVCYKLVPEDQDISVKADGTLDLSKSEPKISQFDLNAVETAVVIRSAVEGSTITALSVGGKALESTKARKDILSRGPDNLTVVMDEAFESLLPDRTAAVLAAAIHKAGADLIICGDGSGDLYAQQVSMRLGALLGLPTVSGVSKIVEAAADTLTVQRALEDEVEVLSIPLPAVISVSADINVPTIPGMKAILAAAKKPVTVLGAGDVAESAGAALVDSVSVCAPKKKARKSAIIAGDSDEQVAEFVNTICNLVK